MLTRQRTMILLLICFFISYAVSFPVHAAQSAAVKSSSTSRQFGAAPFDPERTFEEYNSNLKVQEKGDYTIVTWSPIYSPDGQHIYMSVAKKDKWLFRGKEVLTFNKTGDGSSKSIVFVNNSIFFGDKKSLQVATINLEDGLVTSQKTLHIWDKPADSYSTARKFFPIETNDRSGVIYETEKGKYEIVFEGELSKPLKIDDPKNKIKRNIASEMILTSKRDRLIFRGGAVTTVFNINKKDMLYDARGYDWVYRGISFYDSGRFYACESGDLFSIQAIDENFKVLSKTSFKVPAASDGYFAGITVKNNVVRYWNFKAYQGTNSLQVTNFNLGK
ncbi:hypothetical protein SAMN05216312_10376 [Cohnella sp. OV330]|uniref:hypothetical protein n=1 Tax=Cohnella sp. OV330 TaxID=1855288 RepID=UPI0008F32905|nr:hypothetical protein [Cohnella sp. OV330]SFB03177.1 hypothetical protein SAMN05216312_10376 [Cohnella sp. OV330]